MATKKTTTSKKVETKKCLICGEDKSCSSSNNKFYKHWNKYYSDDVGFCKQCVEEVGLTNDIKEIHRLLRMMDMPLLHDKWNDCTSEENTLTSYHYPAERGHCHWIIPSSISTQNKWFKQSRMVM